MRALARFAILAACSAAAAEPPAPRRIIDVHMHAESQDPRFGAAFTNPLTGETVTGSADEASHTAACLEMMERLNIVRAVVSGGEHHEAVLRWKQRAPEKVLVGYGFDDPAKLDAIPVCASTSCTPAGRSSTRRSRSCTPIRRSTSSSG